MKRGDIVIILGTDGPATKARPCLIIQRTAGLLSAPKVTVCPLTSHIRFDTSVRPLINPSPENGLSKISQVQTDWIFTYPIDKVGDIVGTIDAAAMLRLDDALRGWLDL